MSMRVGADVASVDQVSSSIARFGERFLRRVYTEHEVASCRGDARVVAASLAARFAAKEATMKVLRPTDAALPWRSIEVRRHPSGWCDLQLSGEAARLAAEEGITELAVSLTHEGDIAAAVVLACCGDG